MSRDTHTHYNIFSVMNSKLLHSSIISTLIVLVLTHVVHGQNLECLPTTFDNFNFDWYHIPKDSTFPDTISTWSLGETHFYHNYSKQIEHNGYLYIVYPTFIRYAEVEGYMIEKININSGSVEWQEHLDLRNNDKQEQPAYLRINKVGLLEVFSYRRIKPNGATFFPFGFTNGELDPCILSKRSYDLNTGHLVSAMHPTQNDPDVKIIYRPSLSGLADVMPINDSIFIYCKRSSQNIYLDYINIKSGLVEDSFSDTIKVDKPYNMAEQGLQVYQKMKLITQDSIVLLKFVSKGNSFDTLDHQAVIVFYNGKLKKIKTFDIESYLGDFRDLYLYGADKRYIYLSINRTKGTMDKNFTEFLIFDYEGNLILNKVIKVDDIHISFVQIAPLQEYGKFLVTGKLGSNNSVAFFTIDRNSTLLKRIEMFISNDDLSLIPTNLFSLSSGDLILNGASGYFNNITFYSNCHYNLIKLDLKKIGIITTLNDEGEYLTKSFPNPSSGPLTLNIRGITGKADVRIYDMLGRNVYVQDGITEGETTMDLSGLAAGTYIYKIYQGSKEIGSGQWVKM
ncbi:MAG: T9SS type A sorting domain-containing protein [Saprospiraceae bacterium]|nr:T9SS type A sorting domain-containing protein [Saprospiraceae bacterium]